MEQREIDQRYPLTAAYLAEKGDKPISVTDSAYWLETMEMVSAQIAAFQLKPEEDIE
jgi:hypothetical protein